MASTEHVFRICEAYGAGFYWILAHTLAFLGAFFCLLMSAVYDNNLALTGRNNKQNWKVQIGSQSTSPSPMKP